MEVKIVHNENGIYIAVGTTLLTPREAENLMYELEAIIAEVDGIYPKTIKEWKSEC